MEVIDKKVNIKVGNRTEEAIAMLTVTMSPQSFVQLKQILIRSSDHRHHRNSALSTVDAPAGSFR